MEDPAQPPPATQQQEDRHPCSTVPSTCSTVPTRSGSTREEESQVRSECTDGGSGPSEVPEHFVHRPAEELQPKRSACGLCILDYVAKFFRSDAVEYSLQCLETVADIGYGTFGRVSLVWCHKTGQALALKTMSKGLLAKRRLQNATRSEKMIMRRLQSPFLTRLVATFNCDQHLHILMEAARGGDLHTVYADNEFYGSEVHAHFYAACVVCALEYLHERRIIYRDLKMENVVLSARGYAKLCDFGLSRFLWPSVGSAFTICGTPEYKAPEIDAGTGYNHAVDWWALGVLIYELMIGTTPFLAENAVRISEKACAGIDKVIPDSQGHAWVNAVCGFCEQDPARRLSNNVRSHAWFRDVDWATFCRQRVPAPYVPELEGPAGVKHFNVKDGLAPPDEEYIDQDKSWEDDFEDPMGPRSLEA